MDKFFLGLATGSRHTDGGFPPFALWTVNWYLSSKTGLHKRTLISKYSLFHIFPRILSETRESTGRLVDEKVFFGSCYHISDLLDQCINKLLW